MSGTILKEWYFLLYSIATGICFAFLYDMLRLFRRILRHKRFMVDLEDIIYWTICFFISFYLLYYGNYGIVRFFAVLGAGLGMLVYTVTFGRFLVRFLYCIFVKIMLPFRAVKNMLTRVKNHSTMRIRRCLRMLRRGEGDTNATDSDRTPKKKSTACISAQKK